MRRELILLVALLLLVVLLASAVKVFEVHVEQSDARKFVLSDLKERHPSADSEVIAIEERQNEQGRKYFHIKARVTNRLASACPERMHIYYNYPEQNFETEPTEHLTPECRVCIEQPCVLVFPEEAIIASHTMEGSSPIRDFIRTYPSAYPVVEETVQGWRVTWDVPISPHYYIVEVNREGRITQIERIEKEL